MASVEQPTEQPAIAADIKEPADPTSSCLNDPNYAIICVFLQKFGGHLKIEHPDFLRLQKMIENTDEVHEELKQFFVRLLRKTRKSVQPDKLDSALAKFCYSYSSQDAWEIERFGYKKASLPVKLRVLKEVLESQFDKNPNFRTIIGAQTAVELRSQPLGKDKLGNAYWSTLDEQCNLRIYQEHLDEEIWKVVATNRDEMVKLIACLRGNELVMPSLIGLVDEDSSSNSMPPKVDVLQNGTSNGDTSNGVHAENGAENSEKKENVPNIKIKLNPGGGESTVEQVHSNDNKDGAKNGSQDDDDGEEDESIMSEIDELSQAASESSATTVGTKSTETQSSKRYSLLASKPPSNKLKVRIPASDEKVKMNEKLKSQSWPSNKRSLEVDSETVTAKNKRPSLLSSNKKNPANKSNRYLAVNKKQNDQECDSEELDDESEAEDEFDEMTSGSDGDEFDDEELSEISGDDEVGSAIEEPTMYVRGEGTGKANKCGNTNQMPENDDTDENFVSEEIEEDVFFVVGEGSGFDCDVGNNDVKTTESGASGTTETAPAIQKPMFFFGQAGCLKLSPMKTTSASPLSADASKLEDIEPNTNNSESKVAEKTPTDSEATTSVDESLNDETKPVALEPEKNDVNNDVMEISASTSIEAPNVLEVVETIAEHTTNENNENQKNSTTDTNATNTTDLPAKSGLPSAENDCVESVSVDACEVSKVNDHNEKTEQCSASSSIAGETVEQEETENSQENAKSNSSVALASETVQDEIDFASSKVQMCEADQIEKLTEVDELHEKKISDNCEQDEAQTTEQTDIPESSEKPDAQANETKQEEISLFSEQTVDEAIDPEIDNQNNISESVGVTSVLDESNVTSPPSTSIEDLPVEKEATVEVENATQDEITNATISNEDNQTTQSPESEIESNKAIEDVVTNEVEESIKPNDEEENRREVPAPSDILASSSTADEEKFEEKVAADETQCDLSVAESNTNRSSESVDTEIIIEQSKLAEPEASHEPNIVSEREEAINEFASQDKDDLIDETIENENLPESVVETEPSTTAGPKESENQSNETIESDLLNELTESHVETSEDNKEIREPNEAITEAIESDEIPVTESNDVPANEEKEQSTFSNEIDSENIGNKALLLSNDAESNAANFSSIGDQKTAEIHEESQTEKEIEIPQEEVRTEEGVHDLPEILPPEKEIAEPLEEKQELPSEDTISESFEVKHSEKESPAVIQTEENVADFEENEEEPQPEEEIAEPQVVVHSEVKSDELQEETETANEIAEVEAQVLPIGTTEIENPPETSILQEKEVLNESNSNADESSSVAAPISEKRKSDDIEEPFVCKKVYQCGENSEDADNDDQVAAVIADVPLDQTEPPVERQPIFECNLAPAQQETSLEQPEPIAQQSIVQQQPVEQPSQDEPAKAFDLTAMIVRRKEKAARKSTDKSYEIWRESPESKENASKSILSIADEKVNAQSEIASVTVASTSVKLEDKDQTKFDSLADVEKTAKRDKKLVDVKAKVEQKVSELPAKRELRTRKRRISGEKPRHSSESENDIFDAAAESIVTSSDEEVGGKRIKMRPKIVQKTVRRSVEQKRNVKDTDWSSDENERPSAKKFTNEVAKVPKVESADASIEPEKRDGEQMDAAVKKELPSAKTEIEAQENVEPKSDDIKKEEENQSEEETATPARRGRPGRRGRKPGPKPKPKVEAVKKERAEERPEANDIEDELETHVVKAGKAEKPEAVEKTEKTDKPEPRKKKRSLLGLDIKEVETIQSTIDNDTPVRQSRRIAQIKIREEAERRKAEEIALQKMKEASEKKKRGGAKSVEEELKSESEEENSESEVKLEKKKKRKKGNKERPWQTDSEDPSERDEEDVDDHDDHVERLPPLRSDHEFSPESDIGDETQIVPTKRARTARRDKTEKKEEEIESEEEDVHACQKCSKSDHPEWILLCDKCDKGYHCSCLIPVLFVIPEGFWFCPPCQQEKLIDELEAKLTEFDGRVREKEIEEEQRQRALLTSISEANVLQDTKRDRQRARAEHGKFNDSSDFSTSSSEGSSGSDEEEENGEKSSRQESKRTRAKPQRQRKRSERTESSEQSSSDNTSDNEPIYKLRKRRQANVSYRFNEYDELINRAIKSEMDEVAGAGNLGRGKDITTIMEADKEEKRLKRLEQEQLDNPESEISARKDDEDSDDQPLKIKTNNDDESDDEPIRPKVVKRNKSVGKKKKKLNSLDDDESEDDDDEDFNTSSYSSDEEEEELDSSGDSDSSLEVYKKKGKKDRMSTRRSVRERKKRYDADFIDDNSDDDDDIPLSKKKKKIESDFSDFNDSSDEEQEEDVDSEDLCDDSTDESDRPWQRSKKSKSKAAPKSNQSKSNQSKKSKGKAKKKKILDSDDDEDDDDEDYEKGYGKSKSRRTRGKKLPYLLDDDFDSSDDGIKPGVKRPDTPPEERAAFIQKQEEIKRMLAEKNDDKSDKTLKSPPPPLESLSTIPPQIIQSAKALDVDLKKSALNRTGSDNDSNGFDDDLPEDFDPEDMDEDAIAKMMEEEDFAQQQLKLAGESIRNRKLKDSANELTRKEDLAAKLNVETSVIMPPNLPPSLVSPLPYTESLSIPDIPPSMYTSQTLPSSAKISTTPKKRGRKLKDDISPPVDANAKAPRNAQDQFMPKPPVHPAISSIHHTSAMASTKSPIGIPSDIRSVLQHAPSPQLYAAPTIQHTSSVISHSSVIQQQRPLPPMHQAANILGLVRNQDPIIPSTVLDVQNTRLLDPSELGKPPDNLLESPSKKRGRRKKVTPLRETLTSPPNVTISARSSQPSAIVAPPHPDVTKPITSILSERLTSNLADKQSLAIATPPQLYSPISGAQPSVITRLARPPQRQAFSTGLPQPQRYYSPNNQLPPHSVPSASSHSRSNTYHAPNVTASSSHRLPPLVHSPHSGSHLPHPMYMRGQPGLYGPGYPPPPMHRSLQSIDHASNSPQDYTGPYQNLPFSSYYAAAAAERRSGALIGSFEPFDNKNSPSSHERSAAAALYAHPGLGITAIPGRNPANDADGERVPPNSHPGGPKSLLDSIGQGPTETEFSGLVSYFSSQQDDLDS